MVYMDCIGDLTVYKKVEALFRFNSVKTSMIFSLGSSHVRTVRESRSRSRRHHADTHFYSLEIVCKTYDNNGYQKASMG